MFESDGLIIMYGVIDSMVWSEDVIEAILIMLWSRHCHLPSTWQSGKVQIMGVGRPIIVFRGSWKIAFEKTGHRMTY